MPDVRATRLGGRLDEIDIAPTKVMRAIGEGLLARIRQRTTSGRDAKGRPFAPLSPGYAVQKRKALGHGRADLQVSGRMFNDLIVRPQPRKVSLTFAGGGGSSSGRGTFIQRSRAVSGATKAFGHQASGVGRRRVRRQFFDFARDDAAWVTRQLETHLAKETR